MINSEKKFLTIKELSKELNVKESWIRSKIFHKTIPFIKIGGLIRFKKEELYEWLNKKQ
jgi:excisionase family DNA binding protein